MKELNAEVLNAIGDSEVSSKGIGIVTMKGTPITIAAHLGCIIKSIVEQEVIPADLVLDVVMVAINSSLDTRGGKK